MAAPDYLNAFKDCELCEHNCRVDRLAGETGVCKVTLPTVASANLHPAPPESYTVFMAGCNYKCLHCQNWSISQYPDNRIRQRGFEDPEKLAAECVAHLDSPAGKRMGADRIFFSGGEPTVHLPFIEKVVAEARKLRPQTKVNFDTNGYMTLESLKTVLGFTTSITYDLKAYHEEVHQVLTGASSRPVLRNAEYIGRHAQDKLWEYRIVVIPEINVEEIKPLAEFIAAIDAALPVCFLAFRPNFVLERHKGATHSLMNDCVQIARDAGLQNAYWAGFTGIPGKIIAVDKQIKASYSTASAALAGSYANKAGCQTHPRSCLPCDRHQDCQIKRYLPSSAS